MSASRRHRGEAGSAVIEFVFVAIIALVPLIYLVVAVAVVDRSRGAVTQAARDAGRAFATAESSRLGVLRAQVAVRLDLANQGLPDDATLVFVAAEASCSTSGVAPILAPGAHYRVCVSRRTTIPAVPSILAGRGVTTVGSFQLYVDDYRTVKP